LARGGHQLTVGPGLFIETTTFITVLSAVIVMGTVIAVVHMMRRPPTLATVVDRSPTHWVGHRVERGVAHPSVYASP
jgi:hypothetical protein